MKPSTIPHILRLKCQICGSDKLLLDEVQIRKCDICEEDFEADSICESGHLVCHTCHQKAARQEIIQRCLNHDQTDPYSLMLELMKLPGVTMHGPEHHLLIATVLLTTYCNTRGKDNLLDHLEEANQRSMQVPGGSCGFWGVCGAAIGAGIFASIITEASPFSEAEWKTSGQLVSKCAMAISQQGGPRCCKRDSFTALTEAVIYCNEHFETSFSVPDVKCEFYANNQECKGRRCQFFPVRPSSSPQNKQNPA